MVREILKKKSFLVAMLMILVLAVGLTGCKKEEDASTDEKVKNELVMPVSSDINDLNVHLYAGSMIAQGMVFDSLVVNTPEGIKPSLAESWDISEDGKEYTFHLRKGVKFTDGEPFNAEAVKLNIEAVQENAERHNWLALCEKIQKCEVIDENTIKVVLSDPYYPALSEFGLTRPYRMLSPAVFIDGKTKDGIKEPIGTGAYILTAHKEGEYAEFTANEDYWAGAPKIKKVTFKVMPAGETPLLAMQNGEVNFLFGSNTAGMVSAEALEMLSKDDRFQVKYSEPNSTRFLITNSDPNRYISDINIKKAVWQAINREEMCQVIFGGLEVPAYTLHDKSIPYCNVKLEKRGYDVSAAKKLIEESGWTFDEDKGFYTKNGKPLSLELIYIGSKEINKSLCEYIQANLKDVGVDIKLTPTADTSFFTTRKSGQYDICLDSSWGLPYEPQSTITALFSEGSYLTSVKYLASKQSMEDSIDAALISTDETKRQEYYTSIIESIHADCPFIPISFTRSVLVAEKDLKNPGFRQTQYEVPFEKYSY